MKNLLISLQRDLDTIGLKHIHYYLLSKGYDSTLLYLPSFNSGGKHLKSVRRFVSQYSPDLIGVSLMSTEYSRACYLTEFLNSFMSSTPVVWGGIHPTISPEDCLNYADYVCIGEGERTVLDMVEAMNEGKGIKTINNLCYRDNGNINKNPLYSPVTDLDSLGYYQHVPKSAFILSGKEVIPLNKKVFSRYSRYLGRTYSIITTRGCPFCCTYCCNNFVSRLYNYNKIRRRGIKNVITDIHSAIIENPEIEYINFQDDCFLAASEDYLNEFCALYKKTVDKPFIIRSIPAYVTREKIRLLKDAGLSWISLGLQSGSDRICKEIYKRSSFKSDFIEAAEIIKDFNIAAFYDVITDNPFEDRNQRLETVRVLSKAPKPFYLQLFSLVLYPGTELYLKSESECPEAIEDYLEKDYLIPHKDIVNSFIRLASVLSSKHMAVIIDLYEKNPASIKFKVLFCTLYFLGIFILEPASYFRVIRLSQDGSNCKLIRVLSIYLREGIIRYANRFKDNNPS